MVKGVRHPLLRGLLLVVVLAGAACGPHIGPVSPPPPVTPPEAGAEPEQFCLVADPPAPAIHSERACAAKTEIVVRNVCTRPIELLNQTLSSSDPGFAFTRSPAIPTTGYTLQPQGSVSYEVAYLPEREGNASAQLTIDWRSAGITTADSFPIGARATEPAWQVDAYRTPPVQKDDVLFVFDNGPSLEMHRARIRENLAIVAKWFSLAGAPDHVAMTTTAGSGGTAPGEFIPFSETRVLNAASSPEFEQRFLAAVDALETGPTAHAGLEVARDALSDARISGANAGFLREAADLAVVIITDHPDASPAPVIEYVDALHARSRRGATITVIGGFDDLSCGVEPDDGRYANAVHLAWGGLRDDLCVSDWARTVENALSCFDCYPWQISVPLSRVPDLSFADVQVWVEGVELPRTDERGRTAWYFDQRFNAIAFEPSYSPSPESLVTVRYPVACSN